MDSSSLEAELVNDAYQAQSRHMGAFPGIRYWNEFQIFEEKRETGDMLSSNTAFVLWKHFLLRLTGTYLYGTKIMVIGKRGNLKGVLETCFLLLLLSLGGKIVLPNGGYEISKLDIEGNDVRDIFYDY